MMNVDREDRQKWQVAVFSVLACLVAMIGRASAQPLAPRQAVEERWQVIYIGDDRIGYSHTTRRELTVNQQAIVRWTEDLQMQFKRFGQTFSQRISHRVDETRGGTMLSFDMNSVESNNRTVQVTGTVSRSKLKLQTVLAGKTIDSEKDWSSSTKSSLHEQQLIRTQLRKSGQRAAFSMYMPMTNKVVDVRMEVAGPAVIKLHDGSRKPAVRIRTIQLDLPVVTSFADSNGVVLKSETEFFGQMLTTYSVSREVALQEIAGAELDIAVATMVPVHVRGTDKKLVRGQITKAHARRQITYRIRVPGVDLRRHFISDKNQIVRVVNEDTIDLTVNRPDPPRNVVRAERPTDEYLKPTRFLQSNDQRVVDHARKASAGSVDPWQLGQRMESYVNLKVDKSNFSTAMASASEVAKDMSGDCTEHAVLLAAMLRAKRIPSRVVIGVVYVENKALFGGHAWTEAFISGQWYPLDAMLGKGGIGPAHIKMAQSSFADDAPAPVTAFLPLMSVLGKMEIEVISVK